MKLLFRETLKFAARFLQIPRHHGYPCVKLTATSAFAARDFHPIDYTHAGRTRKNAAQILAAFSFKIFIPFSISFKTSSSFSLSFASINA